MIDYATISVIVGICIGIGTLIAGFGFAYAQFKQGGDKYKDDLIDTLKGTAEAEKTARENLASESRLQINELSEKIGKLQGLYEASEASKKEYLEILQGRDPAQQAFMELLTKAATQSNQVTAQSQKYMSDTILVLGEIRTFMENLNRNSSANKKFLQEVATDTAHEEGNVLRKKAELPVE